MLVDSILRGERVVGDTVGIGFDVNGFAVVGANDGVDVVGLIVAKVEHVEAAQKGPSDEVGVVLYVHPEPINMSSLST